jgi:hypothetical protein
MSVHVEYISCLPCLQCSRMINLLSNVSWSSSGSFWSYRFIASTIVNSQRSIVFSIVLCLIMERNVYVSKQFVTKRSQAAKRTYFSEQLSFHVLNTVLCHAISEFISGKEPSPVLKATVCRE